MAARYHRRMNAIASLSWDLPHPHTETVVVGPEHIDAYGHTNNVVYLQWLEKVAWSHSGALGLDWAAYQRLGTGFVARRHELDYLAATFPGQQLVLGTWVDENDQRVSMWRRYQIIRVDDGRTVLRARTQWVCVDPASGRPKRQPPEFLAAYRTGCGAVG